MWARIVITIILPVLLIWSFCQVLCEEIGDAFRRTWRYMRIEFDKYLDFMRGDDRK